MRIKFKNQKIKNISSKVKHGNYHVKQSLLGIYSKELSGVSSRYLFIHSSLIPNTQ